MVSKNTFLFLKALKMHWLCILYLFLSGHLFWEDSYLIIFIRSWYVQKRI